MIKTGIVYKIVNILTNDQYIGSTTNFEYRKQRHTKKLNSNSHHSIILQNAWNKYGEQNFIFEIIEKLNFSDVKELTDKEQFWIDNDNSKYNTCRIAGSILGIRRTDEQRKKLSNSLKRYYENGGIHSRPRLGKSVSEETKQKISESLLGKTFDDNHKKKISESNKGKHSKKLKPLSEETKRKISEKLKGKKNE